MKIIEIKVMCGPNYWSGYRKKLIVMKLDIGDWEQRPTNIIDGFGESMERVVPSLKSHRYAIDNAISGEFIFVCVDDIQNTLSYAEQQIDKENASVPLVPMTLHHMQT